LESGLKKRKPMNLIQKIISMAMISLMVLGVGVPGDAEALSIKQEEDLAKEFLKVVNDNYKLLKDPLILSYINAIGKRIVSVMPEPPFAFRFYVVEEEVYNAFAGPGGHIFVNSGLLEAMEGEAELAGILAHEIAHVQCRHISEKIARSKKIGIAAMAGMVAGIFLGAGGASAAGNALAIGSVAAAQSAALAFSREDEIQADQIGMQYLYDAGYEGNGLLTMLRKIRSRQWFGSDQIPNYLSTHPASDDRMVYIDAYIQNHAPQKPSPKDPKPFEMVHTRLVALCQDPGTALGHFEAKISKNPDDIMAHYGYAIVLTRENRYEEALSHIRTALAQNAFDKDFLAEMGKIYFSQGRYEEALKTLSSIADSPSQNPEGLFYLARSLAALGQTDAAEKAFLTIAEKNPDLVQVDYFLGEIYQKKGRADLVHYYLGMHFYKTGNATNARFHLQRAKELITESQKKEKIESALKDLDKK